MSLNAVLFHRWAAFAGVFACLAAAGVVALAPDAGGAGGTEPDLPQSTIVLRGALFDSPTGRILPEAVVVIEGEVVACSGVADSCSVPEGAEVVEFEGGTILPGLIDLHVHARPHYLGAFLPSGVTTIRDANNSLAVIDSLRREPARPRIVASGPMLDGPESFMTLLSPTAGEIGAHPLHELVPILAGDSTAAAHAVGALSNAGVDLVKLYQRLPSAAFRGAVAAAREHGLPVAVDLGMLYTAGLTGSSVDILDAAESGVSTIEHLSGLALAYARLGGDPLGEEIDAALMDTIARRLLASEVAVVPTLSVIKQLIDPETLAWRDVPGASSTAPFFEAFWTVSHERARRSQAEIRADQALASALLLRLRRSGALIGAGSDLPAGPNLVPGGAIHLELEALVQAGLTPVEALQAATSNAGRILGRPDLGHLRNGAQADILVVEGDPTREIRASRRVLAVWKGGVPVDRERAWAEVERRLGQVFAGQE